MCSSRRQKKHFKGCAHVGFGSFCHRCRQLEKPVSVVLTAPAAIGLSKPLSDTVSPSVTSTTTSPSDTTQKTMPWQSLPTPRPRNEACVNSKILSIEVRLAREVFGEKAYSPDRPVIVVWTENGARLPLMVPLGAKYEQGQWTIYDKKNYNQSICYERSKAGAFLKKYGSLPVIGLLVETSFTDSGYLVIVV